jgi:predicted MFS family arabinose efflux permease
MQTLSNAPTDSLRTAISAAFVLSLGAAVGLGFGRFAYALLLEPMRSDLGWSYAQAGAINSANATGYLLGTLLVGPAVARIGPARTLRIGVWLASLSLLALGLSSAFGAIFFIRLLNGIGGGLIFVGGASVLLLRGGTAAGGMPLSVYYSGPGIGIALSGIGVPALLAEPLAFDWQWVWMLLGASGIVALVLIEWQLRRTHTAAKAQQRHNPVRAEWADYRRNWWALSAFAIYGLGYIGYMTFVVAFLQTLGTGAGAIQIFWVLLGIAAALSGFVWGPWMQRVAPAQMMVLVLVLMAVAAFLPVLLPNLWSLALSGILFGGTFLVTVTTVTNQIRTSVPLERVPIVTAHAVALFAVGQLLGPTVTGIVADQNGGLALGLLLSGGALVLAALVALVGGRGRG